MRGQDTIDLEVGVYGYTNNLRRLELDIRRKNQKEKETHGKSDDVVALRRSKR